MAVRATSRRSATALLRRRRLRACSRRLTIFRPSCSRLTPGLRADCGALGGDLEATLAEDLPLLKRDGGFVRPGAARELDEARALRDQSRRVIAELQASYAEQAAVRQLKIKHNNFLGYYIETPQAAGETLVKPPLNSTFIHRQTMAGAMRFTTSELIDLETRIGSAADRALKLELEAFERLRAASPRAKSCAASARPWPRSTSPPRLPNFQ